MALYIAHHFGLGDHFVCSGLVRHVAQAHSKVFVFTLQEYVPTVKALYSDMGGKIEPYILDSSWKMGARWSSLSALKDLAQRAHGSYLQIGFKPIETHPGASFDDSFYIQSKTPFSYKWDRFVLPPAFVDPSPAPSHPYAFVHQDRKRGYTIDISKISLPVVEADFSLKPNALDWIPLIQGASEIHCIDSSFINLIDLVDENKVPMLHNGCLYYHYYSRKAHVGAQPHLRKNWIRLDVEPKAMILPEKGKQIGIVESFHIRKKLPIINPHICDSNLGDIVSTPLLYFDFPKHESFQMDLRKIQLNDKQTNLVKLTDEPIILGGGGLIWQCHSQMDWLGEKHRGFKTSWGVGHNSHYVPKEEDAWPIWMKNYDLHGVRDYNNPFNYVPDASCMSPYLDGHQMITNKYGVYYHGENAIDTSNSILADAPRLNNFYPSFEKVIQFLKSCDVVVTNTFHGTYWSLLLGKKVVVYRPFSTRFTKFKHVPPSINHIYELEKAVALCPNTDDYLEECRELNISHHKKILSLL